MIDYPHLSILFREMSASDSFWSVMIPAYNPSPVYLEETLGSVLAQGIEETEMQVEVVDDCSPDVDVEAIVKSVSKNRITYSRLSANLGLAGCWNACVRRSRGQWVHILHQDDKVLPGFYRGLAALSMVNPGVSFLASRSFFIDEEGVIIDVSIRVPEMESVTTNNGPFFYSAPVQCPGVVVRKAFYETHGGFRDDLVYGLDSEMWARVVAIGGGIISPQVLSCYRRSRGNETSRLIRTAENLRDLRRLHAIFAERYSAFDRLKAHKLLVRMATGQYEMFKQGGDTDALKANAAFWKEHIPGRVKMRHALSKIIRKFAS